MRSFALWYSNIDDKVDLDKEITVNINLWDKEGKKKFCFDFGLLVENIAGIENIYLYVPFQIKTSNQIKDLGSVISNNNLVNAIFNENFTTTDGEPKRLIVNGNKEKNSFVIYSLETDSQITPRECKRNSKTPGTILEIKIGDIQPVHDIFKYYFRIRIEANKDDVYFINDEIKGISVFSDEFTNTEVIDFRLNDIRSCSDELRERFDKGQKFKILAVHYLILRNANDAVVHFGKEMNSRMLENDLWKDYIDGDNHNIIAYHIKGKATKEYDNKTNTNKLKYIEDFSDLTRFQYQKGTKTVIMKYIAVIILLGAFGGVLGNILSKVIGL